MPLPPAANRYHPHSSQRPLFQGDVLEGVPVLGIPKGTSRWILLRPPTGGPPHDEVLRGKRPSAFLPRSEEALSDAWRLSEELVIAKAQRQNVILITQSCDLDWRNQYHVAPIKKAPEDQRKRQSLELDEIDRWVYLPANPPGLTEDSYADLSETTPVHKSYFRDVKVLARLSSISRHDFQAKLANFLGRPFGFGVADRVREAGRYGCVNCFLKGFGEWQQVDTALGNFPTCARCGDGATWVLIDG